MLTAVIVAAGGGSKVQRCHLRSKQKDLQHVGERESSQMYALIKSCGGDSAADENSSL